MRNRYRRPVASSTATSSSPRNRSSSGAARNTPSSTFFPNSRPVLISGTSRCRRPHERPKAAPLGWWRERTGRRPPGSAGWPERRQLAEQALLASAKSKPFHEVVAVGEGAVADFGGDAGPVEQILDLEPGVE